MMQSNPNFHLVRVLATLELLAEQTPADVRNFLEQQKEYPPRLITGTVAMTEGVEYLQYLSASTPETIDAFQTKEKERLGQIREFQVGWLLCEESRCVEALPHLEAASRGDCCLGMPGRMQIELGLGACLTEAQRPTDAVPHLLHVMEYSTSLRDRSLASFYLGMAQHTACQYTEAIASLGSVRNSPFLTREGISYANYFIGRSLFQMDQDAHVIDFFVPLLVSDNLAPAHAARAHHMVGVCFYASLRNREAIPHLIAAVASPNTINQDKIWAHYLLGKAFFTLNQYRTALPHLKEAVDGLDAGSEARRDSLQLYQDALAATCYGCVVS